MTELIFIEADGKQTKAQANIGETIMETAVKAGVAGILAECGGACACATCHCYLPDEWQEKMPAPGPMEADMLEFVMEPTSQSRLSCQITVTQEMDGMIVTVPQSQT